MATRKKDRSKPALETAVSQPEPAQAPPRIEEEILSEEIAQETDALLDVAQKLEKISQNFANQQQQQQQFLAMQRDLRNILSRIATGFEESSNASARESERLIQTQVKEATQIAAHGEPVTDRRECGCGCVHPNCCCFDIVFDKVRAIQPQAEPADSGDIAGLHNNLEVVIFASVNGRGIMVPSISSTLDLDVGSLILGGKPGMWVSIDRVIERICLPKGSSQTIQVCFEAGEIDKGVERPLGLKDEYGYACGTITLDCCASLIYPNMPTDLSFEHGGTGGGVPGMISLAFYARRVCC